jgi:hypothetical protein
MAKQPIGGLEDPTDGYYQRYRLDFYHIASNEGVQFKAYLQDGGFEDTYESSWESQDVYGRMDPIMNFSRTKRTIKLTWDTPAAYLKEAQMNQVKAQKFIQMLYPAYSQLKGPLTEQYSIKAAPLFKLKFSNLIKSVVATDSTNKLENPSPLNDAPREGLVVALNGFSYTPNFESGFFDLAGELYPKNITFSCTMTVLHTHVVGWVVDQGGFNGKNFPYGTVDPEKDKTASTADAKKDKSSAQERKENSGQETTLRGVNNNG